MQTIEYWRYNRQWATLIGQQGTVIVSTQVWVAPPDQEVFAPYDYVLVDIAGRHLEMMGCCGEHFTAGETVRIVLRKLAQDKKSAVIQYGLKVQKVCPVKRGTP